MKILFLPKWYPNLNDVQHGIFIKNQALAISKFEEVGVLFVVTSNQVSEDKIDIVRDGNYFSLTYYFPKKSNRLFSLISYYKAFTKAKQCFEKEWGKPDIITLYILGRNYKMYKKHYAGIPFIVSEQWSGYLNGGMERYIFPKRKNTLSALKNAHQIIAVSDKLSLALQKYSKREKIEVIPNIVFSIGVTENKMTNEIKVLTVADLDDKIKNISGMMHALSQIKSSHKINFTIIGEGMDELALKKLAQQKSSPQFSVEFINRMPHEELLKQYSKCNFYLLNSEVETFCVSAAESVAAGRPVVATRCGGPEKFLSDKNSILTEINQPGKLVYSIQKMIEKLENGEFPANEIAMTIEKEYGADNIAKRYLNVLEATINKKNP
jgi:glycosyltransferase involved in cell wall biosynthesis